MNTAAGLRAAERDASLLQEAFVRLAGWAGIGAFVAYLVGFGFYLMAGPPPAFTDAERFLTYARDQGALIISSALAFGMDFALLFIWFTGVRDVVRRAGGIWTSVADAMAYAYFGAVAMAFVGFGFEQFASPNSLQCYAGKAPVTRRSGKSEFVVAHRLACNRHLSNAVQQWAFCSLKDSGWARQFYDAKVARGLGHNAALRSLGNRWLEVLWHCLKKGVLYDEATHVANRNRALGKVA